MLSLLSKVIVDLHFFTQIALLPVTVNFKASGCVSLRKSKIGFLNPKESENGFRISLLNRSIQDLYLEVDSSVPLTHHDPKDLGFDLFNRGTQNPFSDSFGFKIPILDFL